MAKSENNDFHVGISKFSCSSSDSRYARDIVEAARLIKTRRHAGIVTRKKAKAKVAVITLAKMPWDSE